MCIAHLPLDLCARGQRSNGIDVIVIDSVAAHQRIYDLQCLLTAVGLREQKSVGVYPATGCIRTIKRVFRVDERGKSPGTLRLCNDMLTERCFAGGLRSVDLGDSATGDASYAEGKVEGNRAGRNDLDLGLVLSPSLMIAPLPNRRSIWLSVSSIAFARSFEPGSVVALL